MLEEVAMTSEDPASADTEEVCLLPASSGQRRLWFLEQLAPNTSRYNMWRCLKLTGQIDTAALGAAFTEVVHRHEVLRTTFDLEGGEPVQVVHGPSRVDIELQDVSCLAEAERDDRGRDLAIAAAWRPFDLTNGPLLRVLLVRVRTDEHLLLVAVHHAMCDGWSMELLFGELAALYNAAVAGTTAALPSLPIQYGDFAHWEQEQVSSGSVQAQVAHWASKLAGAAAPTLPVDRTGARESAPASRSVSRTVESAALREIRALATRHNSTLFTTCLAVLAAVLHRYSAEEDIVIGAPLTLRDRPEFQALVGFFANTVALRMAPRSTLTMRELLDQARDVTVEAFRHHEAPFDQVVAALQPDRKRTGTPLVNVMLTLEDETVKAPEMTGLRCATVLLPAESAKFPLTLFVVERNDHLFANLEYNAELFEPDTAELILEHFANALTATAMDDSRTVLELPLLGDGERARLLDEWNRTEATYPGDRAVHVLFDQQATRNPTRVAVTDGDRSLTYSELQAASTRLAIRLQRAGARPGTPVLLCMPRGIELIVSMLAVLETGGVYVPVDPAYPAERIAMLSADSGATLAVSDSRYRGLLPAGVAIVDAVDREPDGNVHSDGVGLLHAAAVQGTDPAYICYTSGSTGRPKGAIVPHRAIARLVLNTNYVQLGPDDVVAQASNASFDAATFEIWGALLNGATLAVIPTDVLLSPARLDAELERAGVTTTFLTTSLFNQIVRDRPAIFSRLRYVLFGGEAADRSSVLAVLRHGKPQHLVNCYGPTETTTFATSFEVASEADVESGVPIGRPIANTTAYVLDRRMEPVPIRGAGELFIGGDGVALGYHASPQLTAERFVPSPFDGGRTRLYRTGDLVRYRSDGNIEFLGRLDDQVKIRGFRVEPGEIESVLRQVPGVDDACVLASKDGGTATLTAYVAARDRQAVTVSALRAELGARLPAFMVPARMVVLGRLPINANGKADRTALRSLAVPDERPARAITGPRDALEEMLVDLWERLLDVRPIGVTDDFFELGGHSLLAARMLDEAERLTGRRIPLSVLVDHPTVEGLADATFDPQVATAAQAPMMALNQGGTGTPLFFLHGDLFGGGIYCAKLAKHLGEHRPLFAVHPLRAGSCTIEHMATIHVEMLKRVQPRGPYLLGGYCHGGLVALEMARQLRAAGEEVPLVAAVDSFIPDTRIAPIERVVRAWTRLSARDEASRVETMNDVRAWFERLVASSPRSLAAFAARRARRLAARLAGRDTDVAVPVVATNTTDPPTKSVRYTTGSGIMDRVTVIQRAYVPRPYRGGVVVLLTEKMLKTARDWRRAAPAADIVAIEGTHTSCLTTHVAALAAVLRERLDRCDGVRA